MIGVRLADPFSHTSKYSTNSFTYPLYDCESIESVSSESDFSIDNTNHFSDDRHPDNM